KRTGRKISGVDVKSLTNQTPTRAPATVPVTRIIPLKAIEPTNCALIITRTVSIAQLSFGKRNSCVQNKASTPAKPILIPYRTRKSPKRAWAAQDQTRAIETARVAIAPIMVQPETAGQAPPGVQPQGSSPLRQF